MPVWRTPLPSIPKALSDSPAPGAGPSETITYGAYFKAVQTYLDGVGMGHVRNAVSTRYPLRNTPFRPQGLDIIIEKHGEFYHPARLLFSSGDMALSLALNVAVTPTGAAWMASEVEALGRAAKRLPPNSLPTVYGQAMVPGDGNAAFSMFLSDWFEGFHEFHLSIDPQNGRQRMVVWDTSAAPFFLSDRQQGRVYHQVAF